MTDGLSPLQRRLIEAAADIREGEPDDIAYQHSILCQTSLPAAKPPEGMLRWERRQGRATLLVQAGEALDPKSGRFTQLGLPYGPKARLLLMHLNGEAVRRQSPLIPVEDSMTAFFRRLMGKTQDGRQVRMLKTQLSALAAATFRMGITNGEHALQIDTKVVGAFNLWFDKGESQRVLWPSELRLSLDYFDSLTRFAVPLDERAISALRDSAVALDVYCWLAQRLHRVPEDRPQFVPWTALHEQFGQGYAQIRQFRAFFLRQLAEVKEVYPEARLEADNRGMQLRQSQPPVRKLLVAVSARVIGDVPSAKGG
jgi:hypothetical protein